MAKKVRRQESLAKIIKLAQYAIDEKLSQEIPKVLDFLLAAVHNVEFEPKDRLVAAKFLLEYFMPKQKQALVQVNQDNRRVEIKHVSHLGIPDHVAEITESSPPPPRRHLVDVTAVDASEMMPEVHDRMEPVPDDQLPPEDISMVRVEMGTLEAPVDLAPMLQQQQPAWRKKFW